MLSLIQSNLTDMHPSRTRSAFIASGPSFKRRFRVVSRIPKRDGKTIRSLAQYCHHKQTFLRLERWINKPWKRALDTRLDRLQRREHIVRLLVLDATPTYAKSQILKTNSRKQK